MTTPPIPQENSGNSARKSPPPVHARPSIPARPHQSNRLPNTSVQSSDARSGIVEKVRGFLPAFKYQATARLTRPNTSLSTLVAAIQERLPGCDVKIDEKGVIVVKNIDRFLYLGPFDKWVTMNWLLREVDTRISITNSSTLVADIEHRPSANYGLFAIVCVPLFLVGLVAFVFSLIATYMSKGAIQTSVQRLLTDIAR